MSARWRLFTRNESRVRCDTDAVKQTRDFRLHTELGPAFGPGACAAVGGVLMAAAAYALVAMTSLIGDPTWGWLFLVPALGGIAALGAIVARRRRTAAIALLVVSGATFAALLSIVVFFLEPDA